MAEKQVTLASPVIGVYNMVWDYLVLDGGESNLIGDYTSEAVYATFVPKVGSQLFHATSVICFASMAGQFTTDTYDGGALLNGIQIQVRGPIGPYPDAKIGVPGGHSFHVKDWGDWVKIGGHAHYLNWPGLVKAVQVEVALESGVLALDGKKGEYLAIELNDDFTGLLEHTFLVQGYYE
jgi:hypothetical protein